MSFVLDRSMKSETVSEWYNGVLGQTPVDSAGLRVLVTEKLGKLENSAISPCESDARIALVLGPVRSMTSETVLDLCDTQVTDKQEAVSPHIGPRHT